MNVINACVCVFENLIRRQRSSKEGRTAIQSNEKIFLKITLTLLTLSFLGVGFLTIHFFTAVFSSVTFRASLKDDIARIIS